MYLNIINPQGQLPASKHSSNKANKKVGKPGQKFLDEINKSIHASAKNKRLQQDLDQAVEGSALRDKTTQQHVLLFR